MRKYLVLFRLGIADAFAWRGSVVYWVIVDLIAVGIMPFVWVAVVHAKGEPIAGYGVNEFVTYFIGSVLIWQLVVTYPFSRMIQDVQRGDLANDLTRPYSYCGKLLCTQVGHRVVRIFFFAPFLLPLLVLFSRFLVTPQSIVQILMLFVSLIMAFFIIFFFNFLVGVVTFWIEESEGVVDASLIIFMLLSGDFAPLTLLPKWLFSIASVLPFQYVLNFPLQIYLGKIDFAAFSYHMLRAALWLCILFIVYRISWKRALRLFTGVGR